MPESCPRPEYTVWSAEEYREICDVKRFGERWFADRVFRERLAADPAGCVADYDLRIDAGELRPVWDLELQQQMLQGEIEESELSRPLRNYRRFIADKVRYRNWLRDEACQPAHPRWRAWRKRQMARASGELGASSEQIVFDTACYEISKGCSVGCWFCGVAAPRLGDHFFHTRANARFFRQLLELMLELCGPTSVRAHFLYWASDPMDNPDYEAFCKDFRDIVGGFPQLTTALAHKDLERTRALIEYMNREDFSIHRFSILNLKLLDKIHRFFSPEEMGCVECVTQNSDSGLSKANAGRFRERARKKPTLLRREQSKLVAGDRQPDISEYLGPGTIACLSGFLFNLVERTVKLISPCRANDRWPLGYIVHGEGTYRNVRDLRQLLTGLIDDHMPAEVSETTPVRFRRDLKYQRSGDGFKIWNPHGGANWRGRNGQAAYFGDLGDLIVEGRYAPQEIADRLLDRHGVFPGETFRTFERMFEKGLLDEEPELPPAPVEQLVQLGDGPVPS